MMCKLNCHNLSVSLCSMRYLTLIHWYIVCADDTVNQVIAGLLPTLKELQGTVNTVRNDLNNFNKTVNNLTEKVSNLEEHQNTLSYKMDQLESKLDSIKKKKFKALGSQLEEHMTQTTSELTALQNMFNVTLTSQTEQISHLNGKMDILNASVREDLRAIDNQLKEHKTQMTSELAGLQNMFNVSLTSQTEQISHLNCKMDILNASVREDLRAIDNQLKEQKTQMTSELAGLQSNMTSILHNTLLSHTQQLTTTMELTQLSTKVDTLDSKLASVNDSMREDFNCIKKNLSTINVTVNRINVHVVEHEDHMTTELMNLDQSLQMNFMVKLSNLPVYTCGGTGGWRRVVYLDMTDPNTNCPSGWQLTSHSKRTCGRVGNHNLTCDSVTFPVSGGDYTRVCGRIKAYQYVVTDAFEAYHKGRVTTIDGAYVSGVSLTHGSPRQHIWTFAAGYSELHPTRQDVCPCDATINITIPPFVGGDYFCESGWNSPPYTRFYPDDPLWDGDGCTASSTCCSFNNPPYFTKQLPNPTTDDIEARLCRWEFYEDTPIEFLELYVQ